MQEIFSKTWPKTRFRGPKIFFNLDAYKNNGTNNKNLGCP